MKGKEATKTGGEVHEGSSRKQQGGAAGASAPLSAPKCLGCARTYARQC